jgi:hypothetical protein
MRDENEICKKNSESLPMLPVFFTSIFVLPIQPFPNHEKKKKV